MRKVKGSKLIKPCIIMKNVERLHKSQVIMKQKE